MRLLFTSRALLLGFCFLALYITTCAAVLERDATCYSPNGQVASGNYPCFLDQDVSACCGGGSVCEGSGLCKVRGSVGVSELIRGTCTDSTWGSEDCPQFCTDADTGGTNLISCQNVTQSSLDFCCDHTDGCCDSGIGRFQVSLNTDILTLGASGATFSTTAPSTSTTSSSESSSSTTTSIASSSSSSSSAGAATTSPVSTSSGTPAATSPAAPSPEPSSGLSTGAIAGIAVGCGVVGLAIVGGLIYFFLRKRKQKSKTIDTHPGYPEMDAQNSARQEMYTQPPELPGNKGTWQAPPAELMGSEGSTGNNKKVVYR